MDFSHIENQTIPHAPELLANPAAPPAAPGSTRSSPSPGRAGKGGRTPTILDTSPAPVEPEQPAHPPIEDISRYALTWVGSLDPTWAARIHALMSERKFSFRQALGSLVGYTLDHQRHMSVPYNALFDVGEHIEGAREFICPVCKEQYKPRYASQPCCHSDDNPTCAQHYWAERREQEQLARAMGE